jgi:hypothetical protein
MAIPPPVSAADAAAAIGRITERRTQIDDPNAWRLSDDPADVLLFLRRYSVGVPAAVARADVHDAVTLRLRLWWLGEEAELWLLEAARRAGVPLASLGPALGIRTRQGVHDRLRLAREKVQRLTGTPHPALVGGRDQEQRNAEAEWLEKHRDAVLAIAARAVEHRHLGTEEAQDWLAEVARDIAESAVTPGSFQTLRFALAELATSPSMLRSPPPAASATLLRWSELYESFQEHRS